MNSNETNSYKKKIRLTSRQRSIIVGKLLGDGHLESQDEGRTYRLKIEHSIKQKEYVDWLYEELKNLVGKPPYIKKRGEFKSYGFFTYSLGSLRFYGHQFYSGNKKIIPKLIHKLINPLVLAIWFMDDGSYKSLDHKTYIIHTLGYSKKDLNLLKEAFKKKFDIDVALHRQSNKWRIYIKSASANLFRSIIYPYIISSMKYKLGEHKPKK